MRLITLKLVLAAITFTSIPAFALELTGEFTQGALLVGKAAPGAKVYLDKESIQTSNEGYFLLGFSRSAALNSNLVVELPDGKSELQQIKLKKRDYEEQRIDGLPQNKVSPSQKELDRIWAEQKLLNAARDRKDERLDFLGKFIWPVKGRVSGVYGSRRILNGEPKRPHMGFDIAAPQGTAVVAPIDGVVSLVHKDMFYTGGTIMLQHGLGLSTMYIHLSDIFVKEGDEVKQGDKIGAVGMTGRATGPHLHWAMTLHRTFLDPSLMLPDKGQTTAQSQ